jgi:hypothetical protein
MADNTQPSPKKFLVVLSAMVGLVGISMFFRQPADESPASARLMENAEERALMDPNSVTPHAESWWSNPRLSLYERMFCKGNRNAADCEERPLHPFNEYYEHIGIPLPASKLPDTKVAPNRFEIEGNEIGDEIE